ncbi:transaldolase family protein [Streptomyces sp. SCSIO 30461]|uniref:transaldolase family protein n=1 Tax=Streptomyces sp. SCSIO 30461 TaxID=3118085 RepID=UPI0030D0948D
MLATSARSAADSAFHHRLAGEQVTLHLEGCDRRTAASGELAGLVALGAVTGASWHPARTAFTLREDRSYRAQLHDLALLETPAGPALRVLLAHDGRLMCEALRPVAESTGGRDGFATLPLPPSGDRDTLLAEARTLRRAVDRPNLLVGITVADASGSSARTVADCLAEGIGVNAQLVLSPAACRTVLQAFLTGYERARAAGRDLSHTGAMATLPLRLLADGIDARLARRPGAPPSAGRRAAAALARQCYEEYERTLGDSRWRSLVADGARPFRLAFSAAYTSHTADLNRGATPRHDLVGPGLALAADREGLDAFLSARRLGPDTLSTSVRPAGYATALPHQHPVRDLHHPDLATVGTCLRHEAGRLAIRQKNALCRSWDTVLAELSRFPHATRDLPRG